MTTFLLCRHGESENNKLQRLSGWIDTPLTDEGVRNARAAAKKLQNITFDHVVSSDLGRAFTTAYLIARHLNYQGEIEQLKELREVNYGDFANLPYSGENSVFPVLSPAEATDYRPPNGESLAQMQQRVLAAIQQLSENYPDKTVLVVAHDGTINAIRASFANMSIGEADLNHSAHDFVAKFSYDAGAVTAFEELTQ